LTVGIYSIRLGFYTAKAGWGWAPANQMSMVANACTTVKRGNAHGCKESWLSEAVPRTRRRAAN